MPGPIDCKVYVGNLGSQGSKGELEREFGAYGPLTNVWVARNPPGFAFVEFEDEKDARDAVRALDGRTICGVRARVELSSGVSRRGGRSGGGGGRHGYSNNYSRNDYYDSDRRRSYRSRSRSPRRRHSRSRSRDRTRRSRRSRSRSRSHDRRKSPVRDSNSRSPTPAKERNSRSSSPQERRSRSRSSD